MKMHEFEQDTEWKVSYAWAKETSNGTEFGEGEVIVKASNITYALFNATAIVVAMGEENHWDKFSFWDVGIMQDEII